MSKTYTSAAPMPERIRRMTPTEQGKLVVDLLRDGRSSATTSSAKSTEQKGSNAKPK